MKQTLVLCGLLVLGTGAVRAQQADEPALAEQPAVAEQPAAEGMTPKEAEALLLKAAKEEAAAAESAEQSPQPPDWRPWAPPRAPAAPKSTTSARSSHKTANLTDKGTLHYAAQWGVDSLKATYTSSGNLIRFSYRVIDPKRAAPLADKKLTPYLYGPRSHAVLTVPVMEKVGPLRQAMAQQEGQEYWMAFSNKGQLIRPGDRVDVAIGPFRADGLRVD